MYLVPVALVVDLFNGPLCDNGQLFLLFLEASKATYLPWASRVVWIRVVSQNSSKFQRVSRTLPNHRTWCPWCLQDHFWSSLGISDLEKPSFPLVKRWFLRCPQNRSRRPKVPLFGVIRATPGPPVADIHRPEGYGSCAGMVFQQIACHKHEVKVNYCI